MWRDEFKAALITEDLQKLSDLLDRTDELQEITKVQEASFLIAEALRIFEAKKEEVRKKLEKIKKNIDFVESMDRAGAAKLDIKS